MSPKSSSCAQLVNLRIKLIDNKNNSKNNNNNNKNKDKDNDRDNDKYKK